MTESKDLVPGLVVDKIVNAIHENTNGIGRTTRELRDKVEQSAKEIQRLSEQLVKSSSEMTEALHSVTRALDRNSESSMKSSRWMIALTLVLAMATVTTAAIGFLQLMGDGLQQSRVCSSPGMHSSQTTPRALVETHDE